MLTKRVKDCTQGWKEEGRDVGYVLKTPIETEIARFVEWYQGYYRYPIPAQPMPMKKILLVAGARPNFMKIAPIVRELQKRSDIFEFQLVHTGQHYDREMSDVFFEELEIPKPDHYLDAGSGSHAEQTAKVMVRFEKVCEQERPDLVLVVGDINSTLACSIVAKKLNIKLAHVEAGLRSRDMAMPEEVNRMVTDSISDYFFVTEKSGVDNLLAGGKLQSAIHFVGHVMIDNLFHQVVKLETASEATPESTGLKRRCSVRPW